MIRWLRNLWQRWRHPRRNLPPGVVSSARLNAMIEKANADAAAAVRAERDEP
jgi:hypothetical protein